MTGITKRILNEELTSSHI